MLLGDDRGGAQRGVNPGAVPSDVAAIVDKALEFDKKNRWPDARTMQSAVGDAVGPDGSLDKHEAGVVAPSSTASAPAAYRLEESGAPSPRGGDVRARCRRS